MGIRWILCTAAWLLALPAIGQTQSIEPRLLHLRQAGPPEWSDFPAVAFADRLQFRFRAEANSQPQSLWLRQQDVKQDWVVRLNDAELGRLTRDENDLRAYFPVPPAALVQGENVLVIEPLGRDPQSVDDIRVGEIVLDSRPPEAVLGDAQLAITVVDRATGQPIPSRITIIDAAGSLQPVQTDADAPLAVRTGTVYTANGLAECGLPAGRYTVFAGRGFEYSLAEEELQLESGESREVRLVIEREVPTTGYVACDTHIHSRTHSGHGDATVEERMVTIAGEGIELAVATDHNVAIDHDEVAREMGVRRHFTPVVGNEVTTPVGHFNIFPVDPKAAPPNHRLKEWSEIFAEIERASAAKIVILNHGRDLHSGFRPLGPQNFNDAVAASVRGWPLSFNAMEVINSGATQTDTMRLLHDWMALLNAGVSVTPVGSSDSHDVLRHFVGQGRTYIRCDDTDAGAINVAEAVESLRRGHVMVSYGLLAEMHVGPAGAGDLASLSSEAIDVDLRILGPHWVEADRVELYMNGRKVAEQEIGGEAWDFPRGVKWQGRLEVAKPKHDVHLVAIARGHGIDRPYWRTAKPYQPLSAEWQPQTIGCSGAIWIDADGDGDRTSAKEYAQRLWKQSDGELVPLLESLEGYDEAVAAQAAHLVLSAGSSPVAESVLDALQQAPAAARTGFRNYLDAWRATQISAATER